MGQTHRENLNRLELVRIPYRNRSGVVEIVGMYRLWFARVVIGVTILLPITKRSFGLKFQSSKSNSFCLSGNLHTSIYFGRGRANLFFLGGGYNFKTG